MDGPRQRDKELPHFHLSLTFPQKQTLLQPSSCENYRETGWEFLEEADPVPVPNSNPPRMSLRAPSSAQTAAVKDSSWDSPKLALGTWAGEGGTGASPVWTQKITRGWQPHTAQVWGLGFFFGFWGGRREGSKAEPKSLKKPP